MTALNELREHIVLATKDYRKGEVVTESDVGGVRATTVDAFSLAPDLSLTVDVHFIKVGFTEAAAMPHQDFYDLVVAASRESGVFLSMSVMDLRGGPSYITLGAWLGSQQLALDFIALCELHKLCTAITPATLRLEGPTADELAGRGFVMMSGFGSPVPAPE